MKKLLVVSGLVLAVLIAAISETSAQTIYSCYKKNSGAMRHVTGPGQCKKTETEISWNTTGAQGPTGPTGPQGPTGVTNGVQRAVYGTVLLSWVNASWQYVISSGAGYTLTTNGDASQGVSIVFSTAWPSAPTCTVSPFEPETSYNALCDSSYPSLYFGGEFTTLIVKCLTQSGSDVLPSSFSFICVQ